MRDKSFIDTNVFVYAIDNDSGDKREKALQFLQKIEKQDKVYVSTQVIKELSNTVIKKNLLNEVQLLAFLDIFSGYKLTRISFITIKDAIRIKYRYQLSFYDSLIIATALENNCSKLFSEDLNEGQTIEGLQIINPFQ